MAVLPENASGTSLGTTGRRRRYERQPVANDRPVALTPGRVRLLLHLARCPLLSLSHLARLAGRSEKGTRLQMRPLFDMGLVDIIPVGRVALAGEDEPNDARLLFGSAPNIYTLTKAGREYLFEAGRIDRAERDGTTKAYGPRNALHLRHELGVSDCYAWLAGVAAAHANAGHELIAWRSGVAATIDLRRRQAPKRVSPDAWFVYQIGKAAPDGSPPPVLVGLLELDRGTERVAPRWEEKVAAYTALYQGGQLKAVTGYANARVLVVVPDTGRRDRLADFLREHAPPDLAARFWVAARTVLAAEDAWRQAGSAILRPLLPTSLAGERG